MQPYQRLFRIFSIIIISLIFWNIFITISLAIAGGMASHVPKILWDIMKLYFIVTLIGIAVMNLKINEKTLSYKIKTKISIIILVISLLPTSTSFFSSIVISYINKWEERHCIQKNVDSVTHIVTLECDNGDVVFKESSEKRTYPNGIRGTHFPYSYLM